MVKSNLSWCHQRFHFVKSTLFLDKSPIFLGQTTIFGWVNSDLSTARAVPQLFHLRQDRQSLRRHSPEGRLRVPLRASNGSTARDGVGQWVYVGFLE